MPNKTAAEKALRQTQTHRDRNLSVKHRIHDLGHQTRKAIAEKKETEASALLHQTIKALDKATQSKIMKKRTAARKKSSLFTLFHSAGLKLTLPTTRPASPSSK